MTHLPDLLQLATVAIQQPSFNFPPVSTSPSEQQASELVPVKPLPHEDDLDALADEGEIYPDETLNPEGKKRGILRDECDQKKRRKISHSAIERRRRQKISEKVTQLQSIIPDCAGREGLQMAFILQKAIEHIENLKSENETLKKGGTPFLFGPSGIPFSYPPQFAFVYSQPAANQSHPATPAAPFGSSSSSSSAKPPSQEQAPPTPLVNVSKSGATSETLPCRIKTSNSVQAKVSTLPPSQFQQQFHFQIHSPKVADKQERGSRIPGTSVLVMEKHERQEKAGPAPAPCPIRDLIH